MSSFSFRNYIWALFFTLDMEFLLMCFIVIFSVCCDLISDKKELKGRELQSDPQPEEIHSTRRRRSDSSSVVAGVFTN